VSRTVLFYSCFSLVYCISQLTFQGWAFKINSEAGTRLSDIINASGVNISVTAEGRLTTEAIALLQNALLQNKTTPIDSPPEALSLIPTSTSSSASASITPSPSSVRNPFPGRPTGTATPNDANEANPGGYRAEVKRFTKRDDGITKISEGNVTGVFLLEDGKTGFMLNEQCIIDIVWPARTYVARASP